MATYTTESDVRLKFQVEDTAVAPANLVNASIDDAHEEILRRLDPVHDTQPPADGLAMGEALLAGAHLLRSLASRSAASQKRVHIGGQRIEAENRFSSLMAMAAMAEKQAWRTLAPFLAVVPAGEAAVVTDSIPVLGQS